MLLPPSLHERSSNDDRSYKFSIICVTTLPALRESPSKTSVSPAASADAPSLPGAHHACNDMLMLMFVAADYRTWKKAHVQQWLIEKELDKFQAQFLEHDINGEMLAIMDDAMLAEMQIKAGIPRTRIMTALSTLRHSAVVSSTSSTRSHIFSLILMSLQHRPSNQHQLSGRGCCLHRSSTSTPSSSLAPARRVWCTRAPFATARDRPVWPSRR